MDGGLSYMQGQLHLGKYSILLRVLILQDFLMLLSPAYYSSLLHQDISLSTLFCDQLNLLIIICCRMRALHFS